MLEESKKLAITGNQTQDPWLELPCSTLTTELQLDNCMYVPSATPGSHPVCMCQRLGIRTLLGIGLNSFICFEFTGKSTSFLKMPRLIYIWKNFWDPTGVQIHHCLETSAGFYLPLVYWQKAHTISATIH